MLCTGGHLSPALITEFKTIFNIRVLNYYGLTETSGLCIGELPNANDHGHEGSIGMPIDSIAQVVDSEHKVLVNGEVGKLRVFNDR